MINKENTPYTENYAKDVVQSGDRASGNFNVTCNEANEGLSIREYLQKIGQTRTVNTGNNGVSSVIESIDGVGTKVQIYTNVFNNLISILEKGEISEEEVSKTAVTLRERMLHDLIAMNVDDLRNGEMAVAVTNIIDINHLQGMYGKIFADSMATAMGNVIKELDIAMTAGETAILGEPKKVHTFNKLHQETENEIKTVLGDTYVSEALKQQLLEILQKAEEKRNAIMKEIEFNIGGTGLGIKEEKEKFVTLQAGQKVIMLQEQPTDTGIIGPRSNGITAIRKYMTQLAGEGRENLSFETFLEEIGEKADKIPNDIKTECKGLTMWDIATGKTTVFNPFVSRTLLGGVEGEPIVKISSQIHVTGNPGRKIKEGIKKEETQNYGIQLDLKEVKLPQIIEILQHTCDISDEQALSSRNMGIPYVVVCESSDVSTLLEEAQKAGHSAKVIGEIRDNLGVYLENVGIGNTSLCI